MWTEKRQSVNQSVVLITIPIKGQKAIQYRSKTSSVKIEKKLHPDYDGIRNCPECSPDYWVLVKNEIASSLAKLSRAKKRKVELMEYLIENIYSRLIAGNKINLGLSLADVYLRFDEFGDFVLGNKDEAVKIPNGQAVARIKYFVDDLDKQGLIEVVVSKLKWFSNQQLVLKEQDDGKK